MFPTLYLIASSPPATFRLPDAETLKAYEHLGAIGILLLVLIVGGSATTSIAVWAARTFFKWLKGFGDVHLKLMIEQTSAISENKAAAIALAHTIDTSTASHVRSLEDLRSGVLQTLSCSASPCPAREARANLYTTPKPNGKPIEARAQ